MIAPIALLQSSTARIRTRTAGAASIGSAYRGTPSCCLLGSRTGRSSGRRPNGVARTGQLLLGTQLLDHGTHVLAAHRKGCRHLGLLGRWGGNLDPLFGVGVPDTALPKPQVKRNQSLAAVDTWHPILPLPWIYRCRFDPARALPKRSPFTAPTGALRCPPDQPGPLRRGQGSGPAWSRGASARLAGCRRGSDRKSHFVPKDQ